MNNDVATALDALAGGSSGEELESAALEFKSQGRSARDTEVTVAEAAACLANASGGTVVVGVGNSARGPGAIEGCTIPPRSSSGGSSS